MLKSSATLSRTIRQMVIDVSEGTSLQLQGLPVQKRYQALKVVEVILLQDQTRAQAYRTPRGMNRLGTYTTLS